MSTDLTQRERQKIARRESILQAARDVFLAESALTATVDMVAQEANVSKGTVYLYFESKETLLAELLREGLQLLAAQLTAAYAPDQDLTPDVRIARVAGAYLEFAQAQPSYVRLDLDFQLGHLDAQVSDGLSADIQSLSVQGIDLIAEAVHQGINQKVFRRVNTQHTALALWSALNGLLLAAGGSGASKRTDAQLDMLFRNTVELFIRALKRD